MLQVFCTVDRPVPERGWLFLGPVIHWGGDSGIVVLKSAVLVHRGAKLKKKKNSHSKLMKSSPLKSYFGRIDMKYAGFKLEFITGRQKVYI